MMFIKILDATHQSLKNNQPIDLLNKQTLCKVLLPQKLEKF